MKIKVLPGARKDLNHGRLFYEKEGLGLGVSFLESLIADIDALAEHPGVHRVIHGFHRKVSRRFPFAIFYRVEGDFVRVHAVLDCRRDPEALRRRLRE